MRYFALIRGAGPTGATAGIAAQPAVDDHAGFMNALAEEQFVLLASPVADTDRGRLRVLLVVRADSEVEIRDASLMTRRRSHDSSRSRASSPRRAEPCSTRPLVRSRPVRAARRPGARSGTGAARAPSAGQIRDRFRATARRPALRDGRGRDRASPRRQRLSAPSAAPSVDHRPNAVLGILVVEPAAA